MKNEELIKEAERRFPIGTRYYTASNKAFNRMDKKINTINGKSFECWGPNNHYIEGEAICEVHSVGLVYAKGYWATIIKTELELAREIIYND